MNKVTTIKQLAIILLILVMAILIGIPLFK